jgi:hypothetical protein
MRHWQKIKKANFPESRQVFTSVCLATLLLVASCQKGEDNISLSGKTKKV